MSSFSVGLLVLLFLVVVVLAVFVRHVRRKFLIQHIDQYYKIVNTVLLDVYDFLYRNHILSHQLSNNSLTREEVKRLRELYLDYVHSALGKNLLKDLSELYGSIEAFDTSLLLFFEKKLDQDLAKNKVMSNI